MKHAYQLSFLFICLAFFTTGIASSLVFKKKVEIYTHLQKTKGTKSFQNVSVDLNNDNTRDLLVGLACPKFTDCFYQIYIVKEGAWHSSGTILLQEGNFEVLKKTHHGLSDILFYQKRSEEESLLVRYEFDGSNYQAKSNIRGSYKMKEILNTKL